MRPTPRRPGRRAPSGALARLRRLGVVVVAVALVGVLAGCSGDGGDDDGARTTDPAAAATGDRVAVTEADLGPFEDIDVEDVAGPGTPLGGGLTVPEGSLLLGAAFPDLVGGGFRALLLVTGDPVDVFDALGGQATSLGMMGNRGCLGSDVQVGCEAAYLDPADGESLALSAIRRVDPANGVVSGLGMLYRPPGSDEQVTPATGNGPTQPLPEVALPDPVPVPADDDIALAVRAPGSPKRALESGSDLIGLPGPCACTGGGWSFVVHLDGVERDVLHGYARQFSDLGDPPDLEDRHREDLTLVGVRVGEGTRTAEIRASLPDEGRAYAIITVRGT